MYALFRTSFSTYFANSTTFLFNSFDFNTIFPSPLYLLQHSFFSTIVHPFLAHWELILEDNIEEFSTKLVFAVNQLNEIELAELIKNKLGEELNNINRRNVYTRFKEETLN
ncbi:hypothetical protein [Wolbachia endosymbiont of Litomosoides brasiliensis]|uniref:hypothetical protein n=1 Tax=Wolbachia endosymbiont of Litomosoides brasiliensis TaxID=1812117 RepID=UPI00158E5C6B|nr:hypothetical protein [Wolbachia endosymbiont of Litomosoides brasiliensis]